jgi:hypothetical protein
MGIILERFGRKITVRRCNIVWRQILSPPRTCWRFRSRPQTEQSTKDCLNCPVRGAFNIVSGIGYWSSTPLWNSAFLRSLFDQVSRISPRFFYERGMVKRILEPCKHVKGDSLNSKKCGFRQSLLIAHSLMLKVSMNDYIFVKMFFFS